MLFDFHTHTLLSDGELSPVELMRRAAVNGYEAIAVTDHVGVGYLGRLIEEIKADCALVKDMWGIEAVPGVELTHVPAKALADVARKAKEYGAALVVVHGETVVEPVEQGTNLAAVSCRHVDVLAHPGMLTAKEAKLAAANGVFIEISARKGHSLTNGHVVKVARAAGARMMVNSDAHDEGDLLTAAHARLVALGSGLERNEIQEVLDRNPRLLMDRIRLRTQGRSV